MAQVSALSPARDPEYEVRKFVDHDVAIVSKRILAKFSRSSCQSPVGDRQKFNLAEEVVCSARYETASSGASAAAVAKYPYAAKNFS